MWYKPVMFGLMLLGLAWILVFYISGSNQWPIPVLGQANILDELHQCSFPHPGENPVNTYP